jgi:cytidyltransferase-like protein
MKALYDYIHENKGLRPVVIYGGKFQPFHNGHYEIYQRLVKEFGKKNVFVSTCELAKSRLKQKSYTENHVFTFDEKVEIMTKMFNIPKSQIICAKRTPYILSWKEIPVEGSDYAYITVCGLKDAERFDFLDGSNGMIVQEYIPGMKLESCLDHKYYYRLANEKVHLSATVVRNFFRENHDEDDKKEFFIEAFGKFNKEIYDLVNKRINHVFESINENQQIINEGGVCGHIQHLYKDLTLTFNDLSEIIDLGFSSKLEQAVEKVDGQPLAMTYKNGQFLFAYSDVPKNIDDLELEFFKDLPKKIYREMCERLIKAFKDNPNTPKWFEGNKLLHMEILSSEMTNMIKYNRDAIVFHYMVEYDENGKAIDKNREIADEIALQMINNDEKIEIIGPPRLKIKDIDCTDIKNKLNKKIDDFVSKANIKKDNTLLDYIVALVSEFCKKSGAIIDDKQAVLITKKWLGLNKTHQINSRTYKNEETRGILEALSIKEGPEFANDIYDELKVFITSICVEILKCLREYVAKDIQDGTESMKKVLNDAITELKKSGELYSVDKLSSALKRITALGEENLFPSEGILFNFKGKIYKITGLFADYITLSNVIRTKMKNNEYCI